MPSFFKNASRLLLPKRLWKSASKFSFRKYKQKILWLIIYLFHYDSSKSTSFMLNVAFDLILSTVFVKWTRTYCNTNIANTFFFSQPVFWYVVLLKKKLIAIIVIIIFSILFRHLHQTYTFINNLNDGEMITSHLIFELHY